MSKEVRTEERGGLRLTVETEVKGDVIEMLCTLEYDRRTLDLLLRRFEQEYFYGQARGACPELERIVRESELP